MQEVNVLKLSIELVPSSCWGSNLKAKLKQSDWDKIRKAAYAKEDMHCHICGDECTRLNAHETWEFNEETHTQKLIDIIAVCGPCHNTIHFGRSINIGYAEEAKEQYLKVNDCDESVLERELEQAKLDFLRRSKINDWKLDVSFVESQGYFLKE